MENVYELIYMIKQNDEYAYTQIIEQHRYLLMKIISDFAAKFPFLKIHKEDILQESFISILDSVEYFREDQSTQFKTFLITCVNRRIKTIIRQLFNQKNYVNCNALSLDECIKEDGDLYVADLSCSNDQLIDPCFYFEYKEAADRLKKYYDDLSKEDKLVLNLTINKVKYEQASKYLDCSYKAYDNKVQKVKRNLKRAVCAY